MEKLGISKLKQEAKKARRFFYDRIDDCKFFHLDIFDPFVRNRRTRLLKIKNKFEGKRCFIMGNGPSLNKMDLNLLKDDYVWGSNRCSLLYDKICWRPSFYCAVDTRVVPDNADEINSLIASQNTTLFFFPLKFRRQDIINSGENVYWYNEYIIPNLALNKKISYSEVFTQDASRWVASVTTVTIAALQMAVYLGFNPVYLIGCDTSYKIPSTIQFEKNNLDLLISTKDDDENHFDPQYFGKDCKWHDPHPELMIKHYEYAKKYCDSHKIQIFNATIGGNLETFPRINYNTLFNK